MCRRIFTLLFCGFLLLSCLQAGAEETQKGTLIIEYPYGGVEFELFMVAGETEEGEFFISEDFASYPVHWEGNGRELAMTLQGYILRDNLQPLATAASNDLGYVHFENLDKGYYLILGNHLIEQDLITFPQPTMVMMPYIQGEESSYRVRVKPKYEERKPTIKVELQVLKVWKDNDNPQRPEEVAVDLLCDGEIWDTVVLSGANNWRYTWGNLPPMHLWTVTERETDGYVVEVSCENACMVITNHKPIPPEPAPPPDIPQTGVLWWPVPLLLISGLTLIVWGWLCRRRSVEE